MRHPDTRCLARIRLAFSTLSILRDDSRPRSLGARCIWPADAQVARGRACRYLFLDCQWAAIHQPRVWRRPYFRWHALAFRRRRTSAPQGCGWSADFGPRVTTGNKVVGVAWFCGCVGAWRSRRDGDFFWFRPEIEEWNPTPLDWDHAAVFILIAATIFAWTASRRRRKFWELAVCGA